MRATRSIDAAAVLKWAGHTFAVVAGNVAERALSGWRNRAVREWTWASATFAAIFGCTLVSVDYVITGGPSWNPGGEAYAYEAPRQRAEPAPPALVGYEPPPPPPIYAEDYEIFEDAAFTSETLLGGPSSGRLQNAAYTIAPPINANTRPSYASGDPYSGRVLRDEDVVLTDEVSSPKQAF
jgi:hypothetical protein